MNSRIAAVIIAVIGLWFAGLGLKPVVAAAWRSPDARASDELAAAEPAGPALLRNALGGFCPAAADVAWINANAALERRDLPATETWLQLATALEPRSLYFWINGARIMAYDLPALRIAAQGERLSAAQDRIEREEAVRALRFLDEAMKFHPASPALWIERANLQLNRLRDMAGAAESYRQAWAQPGAPYFAARLHAELLRRLGRKAEALAWLKDLLPHLPPDDESAGAERVLARIRALETELGVSRDREFQPHREV